MPKKGTKRCWSKKGGLPKKKNGKKTYRKRPKRQGPRIVYVQAPQQQQQQQPTVMGAAGQGLGWGFGFGAGEAVAEDMFGERERGSYNYGSVADYGSF